MKPYKTDRLRRLAAMFSENDQNPWGDELRQTADEIDRLQAELDELKDKQQPTRREVSDGDDM